MKGRDKMKFTPEIVAALQTLKDAADNEFELHRINVLERDLTTPPVVEVIDDTHQKFNGITFTQRKNDTHYVNFYPLHRAVYAYYFGDIPTGNYEIHHRDCDATNNAPENLQLLSKKEHAAIHGLNLRKQAIEKKCPICGEKFLTKNERQICCSRDCVRKIPRKFIKKPLVQKICPVCGKNFTVPSKNPNQITCSRKCGDISASKKKKAIWATGSYGSRKLLNSPQ